jgi:hypothetical protein
MGQEYHFQRFFHPNFLVHLNKENSPKMSGMEIDDDGGFERSTEGISQTTVDRATSAKYRLEHFYKSTVAESADRENRFVGWTHSPKQTHFPSIYRLLAKMYLLFFKKK